jgi:hypothetical protein
LLQSLAAHRHKRSAARSRARRVEDPRNLGAILRTIDAPVRAQRLSLSAAQQA